MEHNIAWNIDGLIGRGCVDIIATVPPDVFRGIQAQIIANDPWTPRGYELGDSIGEMVVTYRGSLIVEDTRSDRPGVSYTWSEQ